MMEQDPQVIFVDDKIKLAKQYANLIKTKCSIDCLSFTDSEIQSIKAAIKDNPIKVVVLDQKMPNIKGTVMLPELEALNPNLQFVMLTGEADAQEILEADSLNYAHKMPKTNVTSELPNVVFELLARYDQRISENRDISLIRPKRPKLLKYTMRYGVYLIGYEIIDNHYIDENAWKCSEEIKRGEKTEKEVSVEWSIAKEIKTEASTIDTKALKALSSYLFKTEGSWSKSKSITSIKSLQNKMITSIKTKRVLSLDSNEQYNGKNVEAKLYEENQIYKKMLVHVMYQCYLCKNKRIIPINVLLPTNKKMFRQRIITEGGQEFFINTGIKEINESNK